MFKYNKTWERCASRVLSKSPLWTAPSVWPTYCYSLVEVRCGLHTPISHITSVHGNNTTIKLSQLYVRVHRPRPIAWVAWATHALL